MKIPENRAVMLTAILLRLSLMRNSSRIVGATFSVVWANSQKVITARTMPRISLLARLCVSAMAAAVVKTRTSFRQVRQSSEHECFGAVRQRWFNDRGEEFGVVNRDILLNATSSKSAFVFLGIGTANAPVGVRRT